MKMFTAFAVFVGLTAGGFAQNAPVNQIDLGLGYYDTDPTGVYKDFNKSSAGQGAKYDPSLNWSGKYTYTYKADDANTLKFALADDGWLGFYNGATAAGFGQGQNAGKVTPSAEWLGFGADVTLAVPIYYFNPANPSGFNELKYAYKEAGYLTVANSKETGSYSLNNNSIITTTVLSAFYKYSFDKTTWVSGGVAAQLQINPTPYFVAVLPKVSGSAYGAQLDVQFDDYNNSGNQNGATSDLKSAYSDLYLEPKLTYDFGFPGWLTGFKPYVQSRIALATTNPKYDSTSNAGTTQKFHDTYIQPGVNYSFTVPNIGSFALDVGWRFNKVDNVGSVNDGNAGYTGLGTDTKQDAAPYSDLRIALSYSYKF